jgi:hypothetical protein
MIPTAIGGLLFICNIVLHTRNIANYEKVFGLGSRFATTGKAGNSRIDWLKSVWLQSLSSGIMVDGGGFITLISFVIPYLFSL